MIAAALVVTEPVCEMPSTVARSLSPISSQTGLT